MTRLAALTGWTLALTLAAALYGLLRSEQAVYRAAIFGGRENGHQPE